MDKLTPEELLRPRYKVIAIWPGMHLEPFRLHQVVTLQPHKEEDAEGFIYTPYIHRPGNFMWQSFFTLFPHLFKKLEWWEERKAEEMPEFIKSKDGKHIRELLELAPEGFKAKVESSKKGYRICYNDRWIPATREEYDAYIKKQ